MTEEMKDNKCEVLFECKGFNRKGSDCVYFSRDGNNCKYAGYTTTGFCCNSAVAQVNAMVLALKEAGITKGDWIDE